MITSEVKSEPNLNPQATEKPAVKLKKKELIDETMKMLKYAQKIMIDYELPIPLDDPQFSERFSKDYENALLFDSKNLTNSLLERYHADIEKKKKKIEERKLAQNYEENAPQTFLELKKLLTDREQKKIEKIREQKKNEVHLSNWEIEAETIQKKIEHKQSALIEDVAKLQKIFLDLSFEIGKLERDILYSIYGDRSNLEASKSIFQNDLIKRNALFLKLDKANILFSNKESIVKQELSETKKRDFQSDQEKFYNDLEAKWNSTCFSMLKLISKRQKIDIFIQTIPMLSDLLAKINSIKSKIVTEKRTFENTIHDHGCMNFLGQRILSENHATRTDMENLVQKYRPTFQDLDQEISSLKQFYDVATNTKDNPQYTFEPLKQLFFPLKLQIRHKEHFASEKSLQDFENLLKTSSVETKEIWEKTTNLIKEICNNHDEISIQLNQIFDASINGYFSLKIYYDKKSSIGTTLGVTEKNEYLHPTVKFNVNDPAQHQNF